MFRRLRRAPVAAAFLLLSAGCFEEQSFPMRSTDFVRVRFEPAARPMTPRQWLAQTHGALAHLLPRGRAAPLLTEDLVDGRGRPVDVFKHFKRDPEKLQKLVTNYWGLLWSSQAGGPPFDKTRAPGPWPGFTDVRIPLSPGFASYGRLGLAKDGSTVREADCIVVLSGLFGHNNIRRTQDLAVALLKAGHHVLAYENRGYGRTSLAYPDVPYNYGVLTMRDLMIVSDWLEAKPYIRRTGLIGFCWSANQVLLAAWYENCPEGHPSISERIARHLPPLPPRRRFTAGALAFSPTLAFEKIIDKLETPRKLTVDPALASVAIAVDSRAATQGYPPVHGSLRKLIDAEYARSVLNYPGSVTEGLRCLRFLPYKGKPDDRKLECARVPVVIVHSSNDPLAPAQEIADLIARVSNPNVAAIILYSGGHVGFAAYARSYYYSLILGFFDPVSGAAATARPADRRTVKIRAARPSQAHAR
ncbi:MAG: alpha/beta hydrolase family protein [Phycisphaerae bacterium]